MHQHLSMPGWKIAPSSENALFPKRQILTPAKPCSRCSPPEALEVTTRIIVDEPLRVSTIPVAQRGKDGFRSAHFLEHAGEDSIQHITHDGDTIVVQFPGGGIASDGKSIYQL
jgi:hypothetical protein